MNPTLTLVQDHIGPSIERYAEVMGRTLADTIKRAARGVTRRVINLTPPGSAGTVGAAAYRQGRERIKANLNAVFAPVKIKGRRKLTTVFGHRLKSPLYVATKERFPDVSATYRQRAHARGTGVGITVSRGAKAYVDTRKFVAVLAAKQARVGLLAAGFAAGANALDVPLQQWVSRHGPATGTVKMDLFSARMAITVENFAPGVPANVRAALASRISYALQYQRAAMEREINYMVFKNAEKLAIQTGNWDALLPAGMSGSEAA
ncbi:MAG: hypothetical protein H7343_12315 [Undibacterium sp.]|nr:hypothetical protein [Opitutaceae bacterium]